MALAGGPLSGRTGRRVFHLSRAAGAAAASHAAEARAARRRVLIDGGWQVIDAAAWLPGEMIATLGILLIATAVTAAVPVRPNQT